jgi:hypothetical protein
MLQIEAAGILSGGCRFYCLTKKDELAIIMQDRLFNKQFEGRVYAEKEKIGKNSIRVLRTHSAVLLTATQTGYLCSRGLHTGSFPAADRKAGFP